jgi:uncharacterized protein (TIGR02996 family)
MSDRLAFLRAIRAQPDDDTARLAFADWLDERGDPLGEFIRVQMELEPERYRIDNPRAAELHRREDELLRAHGDDWITTNDLLTNPNDFGPVFRRGLPDSAYLSLDTFLKNGEAIFAAYPTLREVALYGVANRCWELTMPPLLSKLETLEIADWPTEDDAISLSVSPHLPRISRFKLWVGGEMPLLRELVKQADSKWPHEIELVQVAGGESVCLDPATLRDLNRAADDIAVAANNRLDRDTVRVTRPFQRLFPLDGNLGYNICAGHLPDGRPALAAGSFGPWILVVFDEGGRVIDSTVRQGPISRPEDFTKTIDSSTALDAAFTDWVDDELQLELGLIWVREFAVGDLGVGLWSWPHSETLSQHTPNPEEPDAGGEARGWLHSTNFVVNWFNDYWADWRGTIHSS